MKLWIRSADREHFTEVHGIDYNMDCIVDSMTDEERYCHKIVDDRGKVLGIYEVKQRCLEIIDEIQGLFCDFLICKDVSPCDHPQFQKLGLTSVHYLGKDFDPKIEYYERSSIVYEMPKE